jgi:hypothetical protein
MFTDFLHPRAPPRHGVSLLYNLNSISNFDGPGNDYALQLILVPTQLLGYTHIAMSQFSCASLYLHGSTYSIIF